MIVVKKHEKVLAVCDSELIGKEFNEGKFSLKVSERFYKGKEISKEELGNLLKNCTNANIVGKESVEAAVELGFIDKKEVMYVEGTPHAQLVVL